MASFLQFLSLGYPSYIRGGFSCKLERDGLLEAPSTPGRRNREDNDAPVAAGPRRRPIRDAEVGSAAVRPSPRERSARRLASSERMRGPMQPKLRQYGRLA